MTGTQTKRTKPRNKRQPAQVRHQSAHLHKAGLRYPHPDCCALRVVLPIDPAPCDSCGKVLDGLAPSFWLRTDGQVHDVVPVMFACPCGEPEALVACEILA